MKRVLSVLLLLCFTLINLYGQEDETLFGRQGLRLTGAWLSADQGVSFYKDNAGLSSGGFLALEFNKNLIIGFGGWQTTESVPFGSSGKFDMEYNGLVAGFLPNAHKVFHPKFTFFAGGGSVQIVGGPSDNVFAIKPSAGGEVNLFKWFKLSLEGAYTFVSGSDLPTLRDGDLSSLSLEVKLRFGWSWRK